MTALFLVFVLAAGLEPPAYLANLPTEHPAIRYAEAAANNRVQRLQTLTVPTLEKLLTVLEIDPSSQVLVFSKTSFAAGRVSPHAPRAIYFNDDTYVGFTLPEAGQSARVEIATVDGNLGMAFYELTLGSETQGPLRASQRCLACHQGPATLGVPGVFVGSVLPNQLGVPAHGAASIITSPSTPFADRWGGWYVVPAVAGGEDRSNSWAVDPSDPHQLTRMMAPVFDSRRYLLPTSDAAALLVLEHQTEATNWLTRLAWEERLGAVSATTLKHAVDALTFAGEARLPAAIRPQPGFAARFTRGLRELNLQNRVFQQPLSYLLATPVFLRLPQPLRHQVYLDLDQRTQPGLIEALDILRLTSEDYRQWRAQRGPQA